MSPIELSWTAKKVTAYQFFSFLLLRLLVPLLMDVRLEAFRPTVRVVALQDVDQVVDVRCRQPQGFDLHR